MPGGFSNPSNWISLIRQGVSHSCGSRLHLRSHFQALRSLRRISFLEISTRQSSLTLVNGHPLQAGDYQFSLLYLAQNRCWGKVIITTGNGDVLATESIDSTGRFIRFLFRLPANDRISIRFEATVPCNMLFFAYGMEERAPPFLHRAIDVTADSICASIATYPARFHVLKESVDSLAPQVDHLFIFLNNYRDVPSFLLNHKFKDRIHYILDTASTLRAAAKFFWLQKYRCYWLVCDDDIIYPPDYAKIMIGKLKQYEPASVIGVHGTIFDETISHYYKSIRKMLLFEQELEKDTPVHMLGSGTLAIHSSLFSDDEFNSLLTHPTENDEMLAVLCRKRSIPMIAIQRRSRWLRSHPGMKSGLFEETMLNPTQQQKLVTLLKKGEPWPQTSVSY